MAWQDCQTRAEAIRSVANGKERKGVVINTIHGVKGEEYTTMIGFSLLHGIIPNWKITREFICHDETCKLLYVMCSRAKKNLYFSEKGYFTRGYNPKHMKQQMN